MDGREKIGDVMAGTTLLAEKGTAAPLTAPEAFRIQPAMAAPSEQRGSISGQAEILILSVDRLSTKLYRDLLEARGYGTAATETVHKLVEVMKLCRPDLVLLDLHLTRYPSLDVAREIKRDPALRAIPVIATVEMPGAFDEAAILAAGCDACIARPISIPNFYRAIERFLGDLSASGDRAPDALEAGFN
jgi:two-component system cell cycle response regulator DivK